MTNQRPIKPARSPGTVVGKLLGVIRGDRYMRGAYPPEWTDAHPTPVDDGADRAEATPPVAER